MELFGNEGDTFGGKLNDSCGVKPGSGAGGSDKGGCTLNKIGAGSNALGAEGDTPGVMSDNSCGMVEPGSEVPDGGLVEVDDKSPRPRFSDRDWASGNGRYKSCS